MIGQRQWRAWGLKKATSFDLSTDRYLTVQFDVGCVGSDIHCCAAAGTHRRGQRVPQCLSVPCTRCWFLSTASPRGSSTPRWRVQGLHFGLAVWVGEVTQWGDTGG